MQRLVSDACLALLRSSNDWLAGRSEGKTATLFESDVESAYNKVVVQERAKWQSEQASLSRNAPGQPTYMVATLVVLLRKGSAFPAIQGVADLREARRAALARLLIWSLTVHHCTAGVQK